MIRFEEDKAFGCIGDDRPGRFDAQAFGSRLREDDVSRFEVVLSDPVEDRIIRASPAQMGFSNSFGLFVFAPLIPLSILQPASGNRRLPPRGGVLERSHDTGPAD